MIRFHMRVAVIGKGEDGWKRDREGRIFLCVARKRVGGAGGGGRVKDEALSGCHGLSLGLFPPPLFPSSAFSGFNHPLASSTEAMAIRVILASPRRVALPIFVIEPPGPSTFPVCIFLPCSRRFSTRFHAGQVLVLHGKLPFSRRHFHFHFEPTEELSNEMVKFLFFFLFFFKFF